ncbi:MAG: phage portal protein [Planctomycetota bacterium]
MREVRLLMARVPHRVRKPSPAASRRPVPAAERDLRVQLANARLAHRRAQLAYHRAAERNRLNDDWRAQPSSADSSIFPDLRGINARCRQLVANDPYAKSIVRAFVRNVVGRGITPSIDNKNYRRDFKRWARSAARCDIEGRRNFRKIQAWAVREKKTVGEAFVVRWVVPGPFNTQSLKLQCVESEQLDIYKLQEPTTGNDIRMGVEVDDRMRIVAYHVYKHHPHDVRGLHRPAPLLLESMRVPAAMVCHVYDPERVQQSRAASELTPSAPRLHDLSEYNASELKTARAESGIGLIIRGAEDGGTLDIDGVNVAYVDDADEVTSYTPSRPGGQYAPFTRAQLQAIAAGAGTSYNQAARDFSDGSYSSARLGAIEDHREYAVEQEDLIEQLCRPVLSDFVHLWSSANDADAYFVDDLDPTEDIDWQGDGWDWVDPEADGKSIERKMRLGLTSRTREASRLGTTVGELDREIAADGTEKIIARLGGDGRENPAPDRPDAPHHDATTDDLPAVQPAGVPGA